MIDGNTLVFGVIGDPVGHSLSPQMHNANIKSLGLNYVYLPFHVRKNNIGNLIDGAKALNIQGLNVTIPHKIEVIKYLDSIDPLAEKIGAVNTVKFTYDNGRQIARGYNTDAVGAISALKEKTALKDKNVLVLGAGGASRAISFGLCQEEIGSLTILNRTLKNGEKLADDIRKKTEYDVKTGLVTESDKYLKDIDIIVNTTSVGMYPNTDDKPLIYAQQMNSDMSVFDIVYTPLETGILKEAEKVGADRISGIKMFLYQGAESFKIWTGINPDIDAMFDVILRASGIEDLKDF